MIIGGLEKLSLIDYPGKVAAIVFTSGCNFRCQFCYNPLLVRPKRLDDVKNTAGRLHGIDEEIFPGLYREDDFFLFLENRRGKLDGTVITGGEPTLHDDLPEFIGKIKSLGYEVKLDTNGTNPEMLREILDEKLVDYLAMDLKGPKKKYQEITGVELNFQKIEESVKMIMESGLPYEFRTTVVPGLLDKNDIAEMGEIISGASQWYLQKFKADTELVNSELEGKKAYSDVEMDEMTDIGKQYVKICAWR
jgi:pyruvate formate lyase activating enzyme